MLDNLVTISDIARRKRISYDYARALMREKGAPDPVKKIGNQNVWDWRQVESYLDGRLPV